MVQRLIDDGAQVSTGTTIAEWDPFAIPILTEAYGAVKFQDITGYATVNEEFDEASGLSRKVVVESRNGDLRLRVLIRDPEQPVHKLRLHGKRYTLCRSAQTVLSSKTVMWSFPDSLAKIPRETAKTKDITGGLPRMSLNFSKTATEIPPLSAKWMKPGRIWQRYQGQA